MKKKLCFSLILGVAILFLTGCVSTKGLSSSKIKKACANGDWLSPKEGTLVFGYCEDWNDFLQQKPEFGYKFYNINRRTESTRILLIEIQSNVTFIEPLPVGSELKLFSKTSQSGNTITTTYYGIAGVDLVCNKPGLLYYSTTGYKAKDELSALKMLYKYFKKSGSEWELAILDRMEELKNEQ
ncbi:hypothetical protein SAMN04487977_101138 [Treponema bryantii]|uniref:Lipoprotein n=1 Tax=Treponema bryantii TaxID=163 RepID=A0A1H8ZYV4_9SPIR|nr:hypothetical protein [Treponema bryantii]SEP69437.1 hypothetical protein SAMN04487977_101138 [Treponema bryantii]